MKEHPVFRLPELEEVRGYAQMRGLPVKQAFAEMNAKRAEMIRNEKANPLDYGWEPSIWRVCDALLGLDWLIPKVYGEDYGPRMREALGVAEPVGVLLVQGGNRGGKSEYMAKRAQQCLRRFAETTLWAFHTDGDMSRQYQQPLFWKYMPQELKTGRPIMTDKTYIAYKMKTGFSEGNFILPNLSLCDFRNYAQDKGKIEGGELGSMRTDGLRCLGFVADELIPEEWLETLLLRLATRGACGVVGFTPVNGYSGTVKAFVDGATTARERCAWLLPRDGGEPSERCLLREDCDRWIEEPETAPLARSEDGRAFELVPRVQRCEDRRRGVVYFHSSDNPYGNPREVMNIVRGREASFRRERFYGLANKMVSGRFPLFNEKVHVVAEERVPVGGTLYHFADPCGGRNFFMLWIKAMADGSAYVVEEWPSQVDPIPGVGVLGEWALPCGDTKRMDGRIGPAQEGLGWGLLQYKKEVARIEGWDCYDADAPPQAVRDWMDMDFADRKRWRVFSRYLDARFGNANSLEADGVRTLFEEFDDVGMMFYETGADVKASIDAGVEMINAALHYNAEQPLVDVINCPRLFVSSRCRNLIFALKTWTGRDGGKGATKDPVDCLRYFFLKHCVYVAEQQGTMATGGGCY
jgi:hypothetical protein